MFLSVVHKTLFPRHFVAGNLHCNCNRRSVVLPSACHLITFAILRSILFFDFLWRSILIWKENKSPLKTEQSKFSQNLLKHVRCSVQAVYMLHQLCYWCNKILLRNSLSCPCRRRFEHCAHPALFRRLTYYSKAQIHYDMRASRIESRSVSLAGA